MTNRIEVPAERIAVTLDAAGYLNTIEPLTGLDAVPSYYQVAQMTRRFLVAPGCEMARDGWLDWRARRVCQCVLSEHHCPVCDAGRKGKAVST